MNVHAIVDRLTTAAATALAAIVVYLYAVRLVIEGPSWIVRLVGFPLVVMLPFAAISGACALMGVTLHPAWMLLPVAASAFTPRHEP